MRIFISILMFIVGMGCVAYAYVGSALQMVGEAKETATGGDELGAMAIVLNFVMRGEIPQLTSYLYGGALLVVLAVVYLMLGKPKDDDRQDPV